MAPSISDSKETSYGKAVSSVPLRSISLASLSYDRGVSGKHGDGGIYNKRTLISTTPPTKISDTC